MPRSVGDPPDLAGPDAAPLLREDLERAARLLSAADDAGVARVGRLLADRLAEGRELGALVASLAAPAAGRPRGGVSAERAQVIEDRDRQLFALWRGSPEWRDLSPYAAARLMSLSAMRYEATGWPRDAERETAPAGEPAATWWRIMRARQPIPSAGHLRKVLSR